MHADISSEARSLKFWSESLSPSLCTGSPEPDVIADTIGTKISCTGPKIDCYVMTEIKPTETNCAQIENTKLPYVKLNMRCDHRRILGQIKSCNLPLAIH